MAVSSLEPTTHRRCILRLSKSLERQDINELLYLSEEFIPQTEVGSIETGVDLMRCLERHGRLGPGNYTYLASCLEEIGRIDLVQKLKICTSSIDAQLQASYHRYWKRKAIQEKQKHFLQNTGELQKLTQNTRFWDKWMSDALQKVSSQLEVTDARPVPPKEAQNTSQALVAAGKLIGGVIQYNGFISELEKENYRFPQLPSTRYLERLEEDLAVALSSFPQQTTAPTTQIEPVVHLKEKHPLSVVATKLFFSLSDLLKELCGEAEAKKQLQEIEESLLVIKTFLHTNAQLCFGFLSLVHLTDTVAASKSEVLNEEAKGMISALVRGFPVGAILTVVRPTLEALKNTSVLAALKEDEDMKVLFTSNPPFVPCPCKANKSLRFGLLTVLLTLYKSANLTSCEWKLIQAQIMQQFRMNLFEPNYNPFLEIDTIVMQSLERLFKHFTNSVIPSSFDTTMSSLDEKLKQFDLSLQ